MKKYLVTVEGITPYMQKRMDDVTLEVWEKSRKAIIERPDIAQEDIKRAEFFCYRNPNGECYIPSEHFRCSFIQAGAYVKAKVGNIKKSMKNIVAAMFFINPEEIIIPNYDCIDKRSGVNKNVKARIIIIRPKWNNWKVSFTLIIDNDTLTDETIREIINYSGAYVGIGSYRPSTNGYFGRFKLIEMELIV